MMFAPFKQEIARHYCLDFISDIQSGVLVFKQISKISEERKDQGIMVGSLVCSNGKDRIILHAVSGISKQVEQPVFFKNGEKHIIVPPVVSAKKITRALKKNDRKIHELTEKIELLQKENKDASKEKKLRASLCDYSLKKVFALYSFTRFDRKKISLNKIISLHDRKLPPTGTGDCCAPKLLSYAFKNGLHIISMD